MPRQIITYDVRKGVLTELIDTGNIFDGADWEVGLLAGPVSPNTRWGKTECEAAEPDNTSFPGYARITPIAWGTLYRDPSDNVYVDGGELEWIATADLPDTLEIAGCFWINGADQVVIEIFDAPVSVSKQDDPVRWVPTLAYGQ